MKRITITVPDAVHASIEDWAKQQGRPTAHLTAYLVEKGITEAKESGDYVPSSKEPAKQSKGGS
ncbi:MAG: hypothetical protein F6K19_45975 [Cyanothece sp. SIO1E1]|nr:hypothetical protein [Cyanothece sp. SIO1E1]